MTKGFSIRSASASSGSLTAGFNYFLFCACFLFDTAIASITITAGCYASRLTSVVREATGSPGDFLLYIHLRLFSDEDQHYSLD